MNETGARPELFRTTAQNVFMPSAESKIFFPEGLPLEGEIVNVPQYWLDRECPHGRLGMKSRLEVTDPDTPREPERAKSGRNKKHWLSRSRAWADWFSPHAR
jgi:hypothetical protein